MKLEEIWGHINQEKKPYLMGISESTSSKITNAILNESAHLQFERFGSEIINYVDSFKQKYPWLAEGFLLEWLLRPGERTISYCLNEKNIEGKPSNLLKKGVINTYVKSGGNHLFRIETPHIYINSLEELEKIISNVYSHCKNRTATIPKPIMESRSFLKTVNLSKTVKGFSKVINSLER